MQDATVVKRCSFAIHKSNACQRKVCSWERKQRNALAWVIANSPWFILCNFRYFKYFLSSGMWRVALLTFHYELRSTLIHVSSRCNPCWLFYCTLPDTQHPALAVFLDLPSCVPVDEMQDEAFRCEKRFVLPIVVSFYLNIVAEPLDNSFLIRNLNFKHCSSLFIHYCLFWKALFEPVGEFWWNSFKKLFKINIFLPLIPTLHSVKS